MIVRRLAGTVWLLDQDEHGRLCGELAAGWGAQPFDPVPEFLRTAAATHDSGWVEWDRLPRLDPETGLPHPYSRMPPADYHGIWVRGLERAWARGPGVGLFVSLHAMRFFGDRDRWEDRALVARERARQNEALRSLGYSGDAPDRLPEQVAIWHEWMFFWDAVSLLLCEGWASPWRKQIPGADREASVEVVVDRSEQDASGGVLGIEPWPFSASFELSVTARTIPDRSYPTQAELDGAVVRADTLTLRWRVEPRRAVRGPTPADGP